LNGLVSCPDLSPLFHAEFHDVFALANTSVITTGEAEELLVKWAIVPGVVADNFLPANLITFNDGTSTKSSDQRADNSAMWERHLKSDSTEFRRKTRRLCDRYPID
jgi:hypothetical protein